MDEGEADGEAGDGRRALGGEARADLLVAERDEGEVDEWDEERERHAEHVREEHRDTRHPAVDEAARQQKAFEPERGREDAEYDKQKVDGPARDVIHLARIAAPRRPGQTGSK